MKRVYSGYIFALLILFGCRDTEIVLKTGELNIRSYSENYTDPSTISEDVPINAILDITFPDNSTETIVTDDLGYIVLNETPIGDYIIQPRYCSTDYKKIFTVKENQTTTGTVVTPKTGLYFYAFNITRIPVDSLTIRQALCKAINRQSVINAASLNNTLAYNSIPEKISGLWSATAHFMNESMSEGNSLLGSTSTINIEIIYNNLNSHQLMANEIKSEWEDLVGSGSSVVNVALTSMTWDDFLEKRDVEKDFQVARCGWNLDSNNLLNFYKTIKYVETPEYELLLSDAQGELNTGDLIGYENKLIELNDYLIDNAIILPLYYYK